MAALEVYRTGLDKFPNEVQYIIYTSQGGKRHFNCFSKATLLTGVARIYEAVGNLALSAKYYKNVLVVSATLPPTYQNF